MLTASTLRPEHFEQIAELARDRWGLALTEKKQQLVSSRLASFIAKSPYASVSAYLDHLRTTPNEQDMLILFDLLSTNVTSFFRDRNHFDYLERELLTGIARGNIMLPGRKLRIWSAGCSTGCEPYTMAMVVYDSLKDTKGWDIQILATDLSNRAVAETRAGVYSDEEIKNLPQDLLDRHFDKSARGWVVKPHLRQLVKVGQLNLMADWPMRGPFDIIFCRNVMIYFDQPTRERLVHRFISIIRPGGIFAVGSAETLAGMDVPLKPGVPSLYVK